MTGSLDESELFENADAVAIFVHNEGDHIADPGVDVAIARTFASGDAVADDEIEVRRLPAPVTANSASKIIRFDELVAARRPGRVRIIAPVSWNPYRLDADVPDANALGTQPSFFPGKFNVTVALLSVATLLAAGKATFPRNLAVAGAGACTVFLWVCLPWVAAVAYVIWSSSLRWPLQLDVVVGIAVALGVKNLLRAHTIVIRAKTRAWAFIAWPQLMHSAEEALLQYIDALASRAPHARILLMGGGLDGAFAVEALRRLPTSSPAHGRIVLVDADTPLSLIGRWFEKRLPTLPVLASELLDSQALVAWVHIRRKRSRVADALGVDSSRVIDIAPLATPLAVAFQTLNDLEIDEFRRIADIELDSEEQHAYDELTSRLDELRVFLWNKAALSVVLLAFGFFTHIPVPYMAVIASGLALGLSVIGLGTYVRLVRPGQPIQRFARLRALQLPVFLSVFVVGTFMAFSLPTLLWPLLWRWPYAMLVLCLVSAVPAILSGIPRARQKDAAAE